MATPKVICKILLFLLLFQCIKFILIVQCDLNVVFHFIKVFLYSRKHLKSFKQLLCFTSTSILDLFGPRVCHESIGRWMRQIHSKSDQRSFWLTSNAWNGLNIWRISKLVVSPGLSVVFKQIYCRHRIRNYRAAVEIIHN